MDSWLSWFLLCAAFGIGTYKLFEAAVLELIEREEEKRKEELRG